MYSPTSPSPLRDGDRYDVIVVGARAAGASTAMLLARAGLRTLVLDRGAFGTDTLSTHALMRAAVIQLSRWGLLDRIVAAGTPPIERTTFNYSNDRIVIDIKPSAGVDALYAPRRTVLDPTIVTGAIEAGADVRYGTSVIGLVRNGTRVTGVQVLTDDGRTIELGARLVIGADGVRSIVARMVDAPVLRTGEHACASTYGHWSGFATDGYEWVFRADACAGVIPTNDGQVCVFANARPERIGRGGVDVIHEIVAESAPHVADRLRLATPPKGTRTFSGLAGYMRRPYGEGWALVGDAGYFKDPISAHGITDALRDAELLSRAVVDGWAGAGELDATLAEYGDRRDRLSADLFAITDRVASHEWDDAEIGSLLLELSTSMNDEVAMLSTIDAGVPA